MDPVISLLLRADSRQAQAALRETSAEVRDLGGELGRMGTAAAPAATGIRALAASAQEVDRSTRGAGQAAGYMTMQLNDVFTMVMAGQAPLQTAIQQGMQMTQVLGPMGAGGALRTVAQGFMSMLSPVNLATIGIIAGVSALAQWAMSAGSAEAETRTLEDAMGDLEEITNGLKSSQEILDLSLTDLSAKYGQYAIAIRAAATELLALQVAEARASLSEQIIESADAFNHFASAAAGLFSRGQTTAMAIAAIADELGVTSVVAQQLEQRFRAVRDAASFEDRLSALQDLAAALRAAGVDAADLPEPIRKALIQANELTIAMAEVAARTDDAAAAAAGLGSVSLVGLRGEVAAVSGLLDGVIAKFWAAWGAAQAVQAQRQSLNLSPPSAAGRGAAAEARLEAGAVVRPPQPMTIPPVVSPQARPLDIDFGYSGTAAGPANGGGGGRALSEIDRLRERAAALLRTLEDTGRAVEEKLAVGLIDAAAGADEVDDATRRAAEGLAELIPQAERLGAAGSAGAEEFRAELAALVPQIREVGSELSREIGAGFRDAFVGAMTGASGAFEEFFALVQRRLAELAYDRFVQPLVDPLFDGLFGAIGGIFGGGGGASGGGRIRPFARGGLPGIGDFSGSVVDRPTLFAMPGGGVGLMGEEDAEAILPLRRGAGGRGVAAVGPGGVETILPLIRTSGGNLGVAFDTAAMRPGFAFARGGILGGSGGGGRAGPAGGPGGGGVEINVHNNGSNQVDVRTRSDGGRSIVDIVIDEVRGALASDFARGAGPLPDAVAGAYGLSRRPG